MKSCWNCEEFFEKDEVLYLTKQCEYICLECKKLFFRNHECKNLS